MHNCRRDGAHHPVAASGAGPGLLPRHRAVHGPQSATTGLAALPQPPQCQRCHRHIRREVHRRSGWYPEGPRRLGVQSAERPRAAGHSGHVQTGARVSGPHAERAGPAQISQQWDRPQQGPLQFAEVSRLRDVSRQLSSSYLRPLRRSQDLRQALRIRVFQYRAGHGVPVATAS